MVIYYKNCYWEEKTAYFSTFKHPKSGEECLGFFSTQNRWNYELR